MKRNVLLVINDLTGGGAELVVYNLCKFLNRDSFNVSACHLKDRGYRGDDLLRKGYDVVALPGYPKKKVDYLSFLKLLKIINDKRIDIIHSHSTDSLVDASLCRLLKPRLKSIHTFHSGNYPQMRKKYLLMERFFSKLPDRLIAVGYEQQKLLVRTLNIRNRTIQTIWNGVEEINPEVDHELFNGIKMDGKVIIGSISTFIEQKGLVYLLEAASILSQQRNDFIFVVAGDGPLRKKLEQKIKELKIQDKVILFGWVNQAVSKIMPIVDIFFQPSLWEAMSMVVLEAMSMGKPIVATDVGENRHVIENGKTGYLVKVKDVPSMVKMLSSLISDTKTRAEYGTKARARFKKLYTANRMAQEYELLYSEILYSYG